MNNVMKLIKASVYCVGWLFRVAALGLTLLFTVCTAINVIIVVLVTVYNGILTLPLAWLLNFVGYKLTSK